MPGSGDTAMLISRTVNTSRYTRAILVSLKYVSPDHRTNMITRGRYSQREYPQDCSEAVRDVLALALQLSADDLRDLYWCIGSENVKREVKE